MDKLLIKYCKDCKRDQCPNTCPGLDIRLKREKALREGCVCCGGLPDIFGKCMAGCDE